MVGTARCWSGSSPTSGHSSNAGTSTLAAVSDHRRLDTITCPALSQSGFPESWGVPRNTWVNDLREYSKGQGAAAQHGSVHRGPEVRTCAPHRITGQCAGRGGYYVPDLEIRHRDGDPGARQPAGGRDLAGPGPGLQRPGATLHRPAHVTPPRLHATPPRATLRRPGATLHRPVPRYTAPAPRYTAPAPRYTAPAPRYTAPAPRYAGPTPRYAAPADTSRAQGDYNFYAQTLFGG